MEPNARKLFLAVLLALWTANIVGLVAIISPTALTQLLFWRIAANSPFGAHWHVLSTASTFVMFGFGALLKRNIVYGAVAWGIELMLHDGLWNFIVIVVLQLPDFPTVTPYTKFWFGAGIFVLGYLFFRVMGGLWHWNYKLMFWAWLPFIVTFAIWVGTGFMFTLTGYADWPYNSSLTAHFWENATWCINSAGFMIAMLFDKTGYWIPFSKT